MVQDEMTLIQFSSANFCLGFSTSNVRELEHLMALLIICTHK